MRRPRSRQPRQVRTELSVKFLRSQVETKALYQVTGFAGTPPALLGKFKDSHPKLSPKYARSLRVPAGKSIGGRAELGKASLGPSVPAPRSQAAEAQPGPAAPWESGSSHWTISKEWEAYPCSHGGFRGSFTPHPFSQGGEMQADSALAVAGLLPPACGTFWATS